MGALDRFTKYTQNTERVFSVNFVAAIALGITVNAAERAGFVFDELSLLGLGFVFVAGASWLARKGVWSADSVKALLRREPEAEVQAIKDTQNVE